MTTIEVQFKDSDDAKVFMQYADKAKAQEGTVSGLYAGIMCAALKRSKATSLEPYSDGDPYLRFRMFKAQYFGPGVVKGSRIVITDLRHNKRKILSYDDEMGKTQEQAIAYLKSVGISVDAIGLADKDSDCALLSRDIATQLK